MKTPKYPPVCEGDRFGRLVAVEYAGKSGKAYDYWLFLCDCGALVRWRASTVRSNLKLNGTVDCPSCYSTRNTAPVDT